MEVSERFNTGNMWNRAEMHVELSEQALQCMICLCEKALQWCDLLFQACSLNSTQTAAELQRDTERAAGYNVTRE